MLRGGKNPAVD